MSDPNNSYPHWLGLLKWSLAQTDPEGNSSNYTEMSQENRDFLEAVMKEFVKDEPGDLQKILIKFQEMIDRGIVADDDSHILDLLKDAQLMVDQIDMANVFMKFGGAAVLKTILNTDFLSDDCRCTASVICGELSQNNPTAQVDMINNGLLDQLSILAASPDSSPRLCVKSTYGISCIIRGSREGENRFCNVLSGPTLLRRLMNRQDTQCAKRVMFLANALIMSDYATSERVGTVLAEVFPHCLPYLNCADLDVRETYLRLLKTSFLSRTGVDSVSPLLESVKEVLEARLKVLFEGDEDAEYEKEQIEEVLLRISHRDDVVDNFVGDENIQQDESTSTLLLDKA
jgi:hypothetical protein